MRLSCLALACLAVAPAFAAETASIELRPHEARHRHPAEAADHEDDEDEDPHLRSEGVLQRFAEQVDEDQQQRQPRQRQEEVGQPHQRGVDHPARDSGDGADRHADDHAHQHRREADRERDAPAVEQAREDVLAQVVGPERMLQRRRLQARAEVDLVDLQLPDQRPDGDREHHEGEHGQRHQRHAMASEPTPGVGPEGRRRTTG